MHNNGNIKVGAFTVPFTPWLREIFERTHQEMSGTLAAEKQFSAEEQEEMFLVCEHEDEQQQAGNLLELIHYMACEGVSMYSIIGKVRFHGTKSHDGVAPRSLQMRIIRFGLAPFEGTAPSENNQDATSLKGSAAMVFLAPQLEEAVA